MGECLLSVAVSPDWEGLVNCILRRGTPARVHHIEQTIDKKVLHRIAKRYGLLDGLDPDDSYMELRCTLSTHRFLGYDYVPCDVDGLKMPMKRIRGEDSGADGRQYMEEHKGPITSWEEFEAYPWPDPSRLSTRSLEWYEANLPDDMCVAAGGALGHFLAWTTFLMGYETLCYALYDNRDLVVAIVERLTEIFKSCLTRMLAFRRVQIVWGKDDMGFRSGTLIAPADLRELFLPGHKLLAGMCHAVGRPYLLHSDGNISAILDDLIDDVGIDARHGIEDAVEDVVSAKRRYGHRIALLGGIDVDFLCRADCDQIRRRVRQVLEQCMPGGGYCLGTGNSVPDYMPLENYLTMLDEGRKFRP